MSTTDYHRPRVADLALHLYARPIHPELLDTVAMQTVRREDYELTVRLTLTGHAISWHSPAGHLTEITAAADMELPERQRLLRRPIRGEHSHRVRTSADIVYRVSTQVETLPPEVFRRIHDEILTDGLRRGLLHNFCPHHRLALAPLGLVTSESWSGTLVLATFHTFPEERAVVKSQTLIERG